MADHTESEYLKWKINIPGHSPRTDSIRYAHSRKVLKDLVASAAPGMYGPGSAEDHHGGACWAWEGDFPEFGHAFFMLNIAGVEWSAQFCCDPARVDMLRQNALRFYDMFPHSVSQLDLLGCNASLILNTVITTPQLVADYVDSIFNASVPLPKASHTGVLPAGSGVHHYPTPIQSVSYFKYADFKLWVDDGSGVPIAVVPVAPRGSGVAEVAVLYAPPQSILHPEYAKVRDEGALIVLPPDHPIAKEAFIQQT